MGIDDFGDTSAEFMAQIQQLNEQWYVFAGLALLFAIGAFFIQRSLLNSQSIKADFTASQKRDRDRRRRQLVNHDAESRPSAAATHNNSISLGYQGPSLVVNQLPPFNSDEQ